MLSPESIMTLGDASSKVAGRPALIMGSTKEASPLLPSVVVVHWALGGVRLVAGAGAGVVKEIEISSLPKSTASSWIGTSCPVAAVPRSAALFALLLFLFLFFFFLTAALLLRCLLGVCAVSVSLLLPPPRPDEERSPLVDWCDFLRLWPFFLAFCPEGVLGLLASMARMPREQ